MAVVILDSDQIPHGISRKFVKFPGEAQDHFYNRVTHLHHQGQKICQIVVTTTRASCQIVLWTK